MRARSIHGARQAVSIACLVLLGAANPAAAAGSWQWLGDNALVIDTNAGFAPDGAPHRTSVTASQSLHGEQAVAMGEHQALALASGLKIAQALRYPDLSSVSADVGLRWRWQPSAAFDATRWSVLARGGARLTAGTARDGWQARLVGQGQRQLTTRLRSEWRLASHWQQAETRAFNTQLSLLSVQLDWQSAPGQILYLRTSGLDGDFTTTRPVRPGVPIGASVDRAFDPSGEPATRRSGTGLSTMLGVNLSMTRQCAVDVAVDYTTIDSGDTHYDRSRWMLNLLYRL